MNAIAASATSHEPRISRAVVLAAGIPVTLAALCSTSMQPRLFSFCAPLLGPWAGHLFGHSDCTLAHAAPGWSFAAVVLVASAAFAVWGISPRRRFLRIVVVANAALIWSVAALLSVANTLS